KRERKKNISSTEKEEEEEKEKTENTVNDRNAPSDTPPPRAAVGRTPYLQQGSPPRQRPHIPTATPNETTACNARNRSTDKKPPHLCPISVGFAGQMRGNVPEKPRAIGHKPHGNRIQSPGQSGNLEFRVNANQPLHE
ncbi:hypothetical protein, partial [uncultured Bacteroides sp.]|uniref:hypothetical protein n=1 Tax=uncultured Bacteroides sp. TaxID=162156 RepID=UPI00261717FF